MDNSWVREHEEMERAANRVTRGCGALALVVAIIVAIVYLIVSILKA